MIAMMSFMTAAPVIVSCRAGAGAPYATPFARRLAPAAPNMFKNYAKCRNLWQREIIHLAEAASSPGGNP
jgi:hypothetical protein